MGLSSRASARGGRIGHLKLARLALEAARRGDASDADAYRRTPPTADEFGSAEDFPLVQALNKLKGQPVIASKAPLERKAEAKTE